MRHYAISIYNGEEKVLGPITSFGDDEEEAAFQLIESNKTMLAEHYGDGKLIVHITKTYPIWELYSAQRRHNPLRHS